MKKIKILVLPILTLVVSLMGYTNVNAETYKGSIKSAGYLPDNYYYMHVEGTHKLWDSVQEIIRTSDGERVYCIEPFAKISSKGTYEVTSEDIERVLNISINDWKLMSKIAYYGWDYKDATHDHRADKWYAATQMLLWKVVAPDIDSYFTDSLKGNRDDSILKKEMDEIMELVNNHLVKPNFNDLPSEMTINQTITINDSNNVLNNYSLVNVNGGEVTKNNNSVTITATQVGNITFSLQKLANVYDEIPKIYYAVDYQNAMHRGNIDPIEVNFNIKVRGGDVSVNKNDSETKDKRPQGDAKLSGAIYGIYTEDGVKVGSITTDENANGKSNYLPSLGRFYLLEEKASLGYELDKTKYYFEITEENLHPIIQVYEQVIKRTFDITKVYADDKTSIMTPEPNIKFGFYNSKGVLVKELTSDLQGNLIISLPYGNYTVKQLNSPNGFEKINDFVLEVKQSGDTIKMVISNAEITARLKVIKVDKETGNIIKRSNIKFKIIDADTGKYVKQTITYPHAQTIEVFETDDNGILITPYPLNSGNYYLEEVDQILDGYLWNKKSLEFTIDGNSNLIVDKEYGVLFETKFENAPVKGSIEIKKVGEKIVFENGTYHYEDIKLDNVVYGLYADEDIISGDGTLIYHKNDLIKELYIKDGYLKVDNLYLGKYFLIEKSTNSNHVLDNTKHSFELKYVDQYTPVVSLSFNFKNYLKKSTLEFTKTDLATGEEIPNTKIEIYFVDEEEDKLVFEGITGEDGKITITDLFTGKFYIVETEASSGYKLSNEKVYFEIIENGKIIKASMSNKKVTSTLEFTKIDLSTGEPLPNTKIQIFNEKDELFFEGITDQEGKIIIDEIEYGKYYIIESEAPEGYNINPEKMYFEVTQDGEIIKATMSDEKTIIDVPLTEINDNDIYYIGMIFIVLGSGASIYVLSKKKKN